MVDATPSERPAVLVTGAARRIGRAIALELARAGFDVAVHYRDSGDAARSLVAELESLGVAAAAFGCELADEAACDALVPRVAARFPALEAVVANASRFEHDEVASFTHAAMQRHWAANTAPPIQLARALHRHAAARGSAACLVTLLDQKLANPNPDHLSYTLSKAALDCATTLLAMALAPTLRAVGIAPGVTLPSGPMSDDEFERAHALTPLGRASRPEDIARAVRFAIESPAITGTTILVDGGQHLVAQPRDVLFLARGAAG